MNDDSFDPWKSLASELGVDPNAAPPPPPPSPPPTIQSYVPPSAAPLEPKKASSDWSALASDLGIEVPPEPETPIKRKDPVAELMGWPQQSRPVEPREPESRAADDFEERQPWDRDDVRGRWGDEDEKPRVESEPESEAGPRIGRRDERGERERGSREGAEQRGRRRRGGRGRGRREEGRERDVRAREPRPPMAEGYRAEDRPRERIEDRDVGDEDLPAADFGEADDRIREPAGEGEAERKPRRRRGRRRGRGGDRPEAERGPRRDQRTGGERRTAVGPSFDKPDIAAFGEDIEDLEDIEPLGIDEEFVESGVIARDTRAQDDEDDEDDGPRGKSSVRDILTWKEAIGIIIETNMQERSRSPRTGGGGGRGRRGGRRHG